MSALLGYLLLILTVMAAITAFEINPSDGDDDSFGSLDVAMRRFLPEQFRYPANATCDKHPRLCRANKKTSTPDCCKKKCVNIMTDPLNCRMCGYKCRQSESCCKGYCVNTMYDPKNCGGCQKKCAKGVHCYRGMCDYA